MQEKIKEILDQIETVIVGKNAVMERILMAILAGGHVLMEDVPGVGKTTTAMTFARVLGLETRRVQFTSDTMPSDIIGFSVYDKDTGKLVYKPGAVMTNLLLADEITPDTCRFWDSRTHEPLDIDRFRHDLGDVEEAYREVLHRLTGNVLKNTEEE